MATPVTRADLNTVRAMVTTLDRAVRALINTSEKRDEIVSLLEQDIAAIDAEYDGVTLKIAEEPGERQLLVSSIKREIGSLIDRLDK